MGGCVGVRATHQTERRREGEGGRKEREREANIRIKDYIIIIDMLSCVVWSESE